MNELPPATDLLAAVAEFLRRDAMPALEGRLAFHARVAANVIDIVIREIELAPAARVREAERLAALLGPTGGEAPDALLCRRIADGTLGIDDPALIAHLSATIGDTLAINQPQYERYRRHAARAPEPSPRD